VQNISYFCIVKRFKYILRWMACVIFMLLTSATTYAQTDSLLLQSMDSVDISLITCGPGQEAFTLYGHTAIRYNDKGRAQDLAINYGLFSFKQENFILRFMFGTADYEMGIVPFEVFMAEYKADKRDVREQILNLTHEEKWAITQAIDENYRPENRSYRYNYLYDNCSTRARDMITDHIRGSVAYAIKQQAAPSFRKMIHDWNEQERWARYGNDLLLGVKADAKTSNTDRQFLPDSLFKDFAQAVIIDNNGHQRPLVSTTRHLNSPSKTAVKSTSPFSPFGCSLAFLAFILLVCATEWKTKRLFWGADAFLMIISGFAGIILFLMIFSQQPTVNVNFQILVLCPLSLFFAIPVARSISKHRAHAYMKIGIALLILFMVLSFWQHYAEGMRIVALSLLIRIVWLHCYTTRKNKQNE